MKQRLNSSSLKGVSRRVVIIPCGSDSVFEQILCIVRDEKLVQHGVTAETILQEAQLLITEGETESPFYPARNSRRRYFHAILLILLIAGIVLLILKTS